MSRIDDALKRAAGDDVPLRERTDSMSQAARRDEESSLERYPREGRAPIEKPTRSELSSSRPIAAPRTGGRGQLAPTRPELEGKLVISGQTAPVAVEQYRRLAATLHQLQTERGLKMLLVTSTVPEEGKTLTVANLALTLSESYKRRVLLIDADLRRPSIHEVFGLPNLTGLTDGLRARARPAPGPRSVAPLECRAGRPSGREPDGQADIGEDAGASGGGLRRVRLGSPRRAAQSD